MKARGRRKDEGASPSSPQLDDEVSSTFGGENRVSNISISEA
jgi:hypothetical protein